MPETLTAADPPGLSAPRPARAREVVAWILVIFTLALAILGAFQRSSDDLAIAISTLAGGATDTLQGLGRALPLGYAFGVGMAAAVNPCGVALLPTYLGLYLGTAGLRPRPWPAKLAHAVTIGATMTLSFVALFGAAGLILGAAGAAAGALLPWLSIAVGVALVLAGGRLLAGGSIDASTAERLADALGGAAARTDLLGYAAYGLAFALSSLGCALPLFLAVFGSGLARGGVADAFEQLVLYALGMGAVVSALTVVVAVLGHSVLRRVRGAGRALQPLSAVLLLATGGYIVYYWLSAGGIVA
jgi:cytochrome c-type biogenesis protein